MPNINIFDHIQATNQELFKASMSDEFQIRCPTCNITHTKRKSGILHCLENKEVRLIYCCGKCYKASFDLRSKLICKQCRRAYMHRTYTLSCASVMIGYCSMECYSFADEKLDMIKTVQGVYDDSDEQSDTS